MMAFRELPFVVLPSILFLFASAARGQSACNNNQRFKPDPDVYYTIASPETLNVWSVAGTGIGSKVVLVNPTNLTSASHWSFLYNETERTWVVRNRESGLDVSMYFPNEGYFALTSTDDNDMGLPTKTANFVADCNHIDEVFFQLDEQAFGYDGEDMYARCGIDGCSEGSKVNLRPLMRRIAQKTECTIFPPTCEAAFGSDWEIDFVDTCDLDNNEENGEESFYYTCVSFIEDESQRKEQTWMVEEVPESRRHLEVFNHLALDLSKRLASVVALGDTTKCPLCGGLHGMLQAIRDFDATQEPELGNEMLDDDDETFYDLGFNDDDLDEVRYVLNRLTYHQLFFIQEYRQEKENAILHADMDYLSSLRGELVAGVAIFRQDITSLSENRQIPLEWFQLALSELLFMEQEIFLLVAYIHEESSCEDLMEQYRMDVVVDEYSLWLDELTESVNQDGQDDTVIDALLDSYVEHTLIMCNALGSDPDFRELFETGVMEP